MNLFDLVERFPSHERCISLLEDVVGVNIPNVFIVRAITLLARKKTARSDAGTVTPASPASMS